MWLRKLSANLFGSSKLPRLSYSWLRKTAPRKIPKLSRLSIHYRDRRYGSYYHRWHAEE